MHMSTVVIVADWIKRVAEDERKRDAVRLGEQAEAARKADLVRLHGRRLVDELRAAVLRDVESFHSEFPDDRSRDIVVDVTKFDGGFAVRRPAPPPVSLTVDPRLDAATIACHYRFTAAGRLPPRDDRFDLVFADNADGAVLLKHHGNARTFATADALSEFLLLPVLTGRPR